MKFLCVKIGKKYSSQTVNTLLDKLTSNYTGTVELYCLTDNELGLSDFVIPIFSKFIENFRHDLYISKYDRIH